MTTDIQVNYWNGKSEVVSADQLDHLNQSPIIKELSLCGVVSSIDFDEKWINLIIGNTSITIMITSTQTIEAFKQTISFLLSLMDKKVFIKTNRISKVSKKYMRILDEGLLITEIQE